MIRTKSSSIYFKCGSPEQKPLSFSPYKKKWYKWHHVMGFIFGFFTFTFVFSGMMSLQDIPNFIIPVNEKVDYQTQWNSKRFELTDFKLTVPKLLSGLDISSAKRIDWCFSSLNKPYYRVYTNNLTQPLLVDASQQYSIILSVLSLENIEKEVQERLNISNYECFWLTNSDGYYMKSQRHPFPVVKIILSDKDKTWLYINPKDLKVLSLLNRNKRIHRWLYKGLHSFNFKLFIGHDWLRIAILMVLSIFGTIISISGLVLSYKYFKRKGKKKRHNIIKLD